MASARVTDVKEGGRILLGRIEPPLGGGKCVMLEIHRQNGDGSLGIYVIALTLEEFSSFKNDVVNFHLEMSR